MQYVAREIMNHSHLLHPHIVQFKEVRLAAILTKHVLHILCGSSWRMQARR